MDRAVLQLAQLAVQQVGLGDDAVTDYLDVGLSQTDYVGHRYGPLSQEQLDNLFRLDRELGDFFDFLDRSVGRGQWVAVVAADHGTLTMPEWRASHGEAGHRVTPAERAPRRQPRPPGRRRRGARPQAQPSPGPCAPCRSSPTP